MPVTSFLSRLHPNHLRQHPILADPVSLTALLVAAGVNIANLVLVAAKLRQVDYPVPVHYLSFVGFDQMGPWYQNYRLGLFAVAVTILNTALAAKAFGRNRLASFFLLIGAAAVAVLCLVISSAFIAVV
ncbi:hypothetical protein EPO04_02675 [Patescibacteria group bacterium]|nr:MAG: hypothetical protein EPO04_02675 [Patescibacteria group bacterium]